MKFNQNINNWNINKSTTNLKNILVFAMDFNYPLTNWGINHINFEIYLKGSKIAKTYLNNYILDSNIKTLVNDYFNNTNTHLLTRDKPIGEWDVSLVTNMDSLFYDFNKSLKFNEPLNNWNTSNVVTMASMFRNCEYFNQPLQNLPTSLCQLKFNDFSRFNQPLKNLPKNLTLLKLGGNYNHPMEDLPMSLRLLIINKNYKSYILGTHFQIVKSI